MLGLVLLALFLVPRGDRETRTRRERPNVLLIIGDDHGWPYYGFAEAGVQFLKTNAGKSSVHEIAQTPNLDRLAATGTLFRNGYTTASTCSPSLHTLLSAGGLDPLQWSARLAALQATELGPLPSRREAPHYRTLPSHPPA